MSQKVAKKYSCKKCDYHTTNKFDWNKHITTTKHKNGNFRVTNKQNLLMYICENCGKEYKFKSGLSRHKKKCTESIKNNLLNISTKSRQSINGINNGVLPQGTPKDGVNYVPIDLKNPNNGRIHPLNFIEMSGEKFLDFYRDGETEEISSKRYLKNDNRKLLFFVFDSTCAFATSI